MEAKYFAVPGFFLFGAAITAYGLILREDTPFWVLLIPPVFMGLGSAMIWPSVSLTATRDLGQADAGAGSGIYNTTRQVGAVLGSALIALMMESRISAESQKAVAAIAKTGSDGASSIGAGHRRGARDGRRGPRVPAPGVLAGPGPGAVAAGPGGDRRIRWWR